MPEKSLLCQPQILLHIQVRKSPWIAKEYFWSTSSEGIEAIVSEAL
jgi:hypothetical protein